MCSSDLGAGIWPHDGAHSSILIRGDHLYVNTATGVDNTHKRIRAPNAPSLAVIDKIAKLGGTGGMIVIDKNGKIALPFNTSGMYRGYVDPNGKFVTEIYR